MMRWLRKLLGLHQWRYRNPFDRTCEICGRREVEHCYSDSRMGEGWWEVFNEGEASKHQEKKGTP